MAAKEMRDFKDIQDAIMAHLKIQSSDSVSRERIKQDINLMYDQVLEFRDWWWVNGNTTARIDPFVNTGTVAVTKDSTAITFSASVTDSKAGHYFNVSGQREVYRISTHTAGTATMVLDASFTGETNSAIGYKTWNPTIALPLDCQDVTTVWTDHLNEPLRPKGPAKLRELMSNTGWTVQGRPRNYAVLDYNAPTDPEVETDRFREMLVHPAILNKATTIKIDYVKETVALDLDADEPIMPIKDRIVLYFGALAEAWHRERNPEASARYDGKFQIKLAKMAGKQQGSQDNPKLHTNKDYFNRKRDQGFFLNAFPLAEALSNFTGTTQGDLDMWTKVNLNDNQATAQTIVTENRKMVHFQYAIRRGTSDTEGGDLYLVTPTDLSDVAYSPQSVEVGDTGITLIGAVSGINLQVQYTSTSTGTAAELWYKLEGPT